MLHKGAVKVREGWEAEEDVADVGGEVDAFLPILPQHPRQGKKQGF